MCGLVGVAGDIQTKHKDAFNDMLLFNVPRGRDSTGVFSVDRDLGRINKDMYLLKRAVPAWDLMEFKGYDRIVNTIKYCIIGHGRKATVGKINSSNAHPFDFSKLAGAHNGTLPHDVVKSIPDSDKFGTDSEALYNFINEVGFKEAMEALAGGGAYALTWYDKVEKTINLFRNSQRPLFYSLVNDGKTLMWGSESEIIHAAAARDNRNIDTDGNTYSLGENVWYSFKIPENSSGKFEDPVETEIKMQEARSVTTYYESARSHNGSPFQGNHTGTPPRSGSVVTMGGSPYNKLKVAKILEEPKYKRGRRCGTIQLIEGWNGRKLSKKEFDSLTGCVCKYSDEVVSFDDVIKKRQNIVFINETEFVMSEFNTTQWHQWMQEYHGLDDEPEQENMHRMFGGYC